MKDINDTTKFEDIDYSTFREKSTSGNAGKKGAKKVTMTKAAYKKAVITIASLASCVVVTVCALGNLAYKGISDDIAICNARKECRIECISPETYRTQNYEGYYYEYNHIYANLVEKYGEDIGLYLFYQATGSKHQLDRMCNEGIGEYRDFDDYLTKHRYKSFEEWEKLMKRKTLLSFEDEQIHNQLDEINEDHKKVEIIFDDEESTTEMTSEEFGGGSKR